MATGKQTTAVLAACALSAGLGAGAAWRAHDATEKRAWKATLNGIFDPLVQQQTAGASPAEACIVNSIANAVVDRVADDPRSSVSVLLQTQTGEVSAETLQGLADFIAPIKSGFEASSKGCIDLATDAVEKDRVTQERNQILRAMTEAPLPRF